VSGTTDAHGRAASNVSAGHKITHVPYRGQSRTELHVHPRRAPRLPQRDITYFYRGDSTAAAASLAVARNAHARRCCPTCRRAGAWLQGRLHGELVRALVAAAAPTEVGAKLEAAVLDAVEEPGSVGGRVSANGCYAPQDAKAFRASDRGRTWLYWGARSRSSA